MARDRSSASRSATPWWAASPSRKSSPSTRRRSSFSISRERKAGSPAGRSRCRKSAAPRCRRSKGGLHYAFPVKVGAAVAEEAPFGAIPFDLIQIELVKDDALLILAEAGDNLAGMVGDEGMAVVALAHAVVHFFADAVGGDHRH